MMGIKTVGGIIPVLPQPGPTDEDLKLTFEEFEEKYGITESMNDLPGNRPCTHHSFTEGLFAGLVIGIICFAAAAAAYLILR